jgi:hypothetical protein
MVKRAVAGTKAECEAFTTVTIGDSTMIFSEIMTIHQKLTLQVLTIYTFASKK